MLFSGKLYNDCRKVGFHGFIKKDRDGKSSATRGKDPQDILKIRNDAINLIYRRSRGSVPMESSRVLAARFPIPRALIARRWKS